MVPADLPENALIQRAQRRDPDAIGELYRRYSGQIYRYFRFRVTDEAVAQDLTGEVFLNMLESLPKYKDRGVPFAAWLYQMAYARAVDHYRRQGRRPTDELTEQLPDAGPGPETMVAEQYEFEQLRQAMGQLSDDYRTVVQLRFIEGYDLEQTALTMRKSLAATKIMQHRAVRQLARILEK